VNEKQRRLSERGSRVGAFLSANAADFPAGSKGGELAAGLKAELSNLSTLDVVKATGASARQQSSLGRRDFRESLRALVASVCDTADAIALDHAEVKGLFPRTLPNRSDSTLFAVARSFATTAAPLKSLFVEYDMPADFIDSLKADADGLERQMTLQSETTGARVGANASISETLRRADELVDKLDVIVSNKYRNDPAKLAAWESARRLERAPRTKRTGDAPPTPPTN
jgi:hypothetical protein